MGAKTELVLMWRVVAMANEQKHSYILARSGWRLGLFYITTITNTIVVFNFIIIIVVSVAWAGC